MPRDIVQSTKLALAYAPLATASADNTAIAFAEVDRAGYDLVELIFITGILSDADATFTLLIQESDTSGSGFTDVADADLIGTEASGAPLFSSDSKTIKIGYKGLKRYVKGSLTPASNTGNVPIGACWVLSGAKSLPLTTQITA